jgi:hypothetical protein
MKVFGSTHLSLIPVGKLLRNLTAALGALLLFSAVASAQVETGQIAGNVTDSSGAVVAGAAVTATNLATNAARNTVSSSTGDYQIPGLEPAIYQVTVNSSGFKSYTVKVEVTVGSHVTLDAKLSVNASTTEVEVVGEGGATVNTQSQELSQVVNTQQMAQLPSLTRNPYDFVALSGNVSAGDSTSASSSAAGITGGQNLTSRGAGYAVNGQRESGTEILLDGVENIGVFSAGLGEDVPMDATQEYSVITNNFSAEYGRASGGVVNVSTKAGTNAFHGSGWEYNRLSAYTANTYANDATGVPKGTYARNQFGYAVGGPILKDKLFFFQSTEWTRIRSDAQVTEEIFDPSFIDLMPSNIQAYYKTYGATTFKSAGVAATVSQLENLTSNSIQIGEVNGTTPVPAGTPVFDTINFAVPFNAGGGVPGNQYDLVGRIDFDPTSKTTMFFRAGRENIDDFTGAEFYSAYPQYDVGESILNQTYLYSVSHTFTPNLFLSGKASFSRYNTIDPFNASLTDTPSLMFLSPTDPVTGELLQMPGIENYSEPGAGGLPFGGPQNTIQFEPDLAWTKGRHSMRFGGTYTYIQLNFAYGAYAQAVEQLGAASQDSMNDLLNTAGNPNGSPLVNFAARVDPQGKLPCAVDIYGNLPANPPSSCLVQPPLSSANYARSYRYNDWAIYGQDSYKATPQLTLNYGLRWEHYGVQHNNHQSLDSNFYLGSGSSLEQQVANGNVYITGQSPIGQFWKPRWGTLAPRVGFAYDIFGNGKDSIRGGYGISYERNFGNVTYNTSFNPPASAVVSDSCGPESSTCPTTVTNLDLGPLGVAGPAQALPPSELRFVDDLIQVAQTQFWSLAVEHQLVPGTVIGISYSGAKGSHLYDLANVNQAGAAQVYLNAPVITGPQCANVGYTNNITGADECLSRPNQQYTDVNMRGDQAASNYEALNLKLEMEDVHHTGLSVTGNYTWSHALDDLSSTFGDSLQGGSGYIGSLGYTSLANPGLDWGSADFDVRNRLALSPIWETPWFKQGPMMEREALGGWTFSGIYTARTGSPFSVFDYDNDVTDYTVPRLTPATPLSSYSVAKNPKPTGANLFNGLNIPLPASVTPLSSTLGISDYGPFPINMMRRNSLRGPGAWNYDMAMEKSFPITERVGMVFRAEGFNLLNHHNFYVNPTTLSYSDVTPTTTPLFVSEEKGGLGTLAEGGNYDERRFGQFALRLTF